MTDSAPASAWKPGLPHEVRDYAVGSAQLFTLSNLDGEMLALQDSLMNCDGQATEACDPEAQIHFQVLRDVPGTSQKILNSCAAR